VTDVGAKCVPETKIRLDMSVEQFADHLGPAAARYLESKVDVVAAEEALRTALFRIDNAIRPFRGRQT